MTITLKALADEIGMDRSHLRRFVSRMGISPLRERIPGAKGSPLLAVTDEEAEQIREARREAGFWVGGRATPVRDGHGHFYTVELDPEARPGRLKLGFTNSVRARLADHRTAAPHAVLLRSWPCKRSWEPAAIDALSLAGERVTDEIYDMSNVDEVVNRGDRFFSMLPSLGDC